MSRENTHFTPTPFDLHNYTNSDIANSAKPQPIQNTTDDPKIISNLQLLHKAVQKIEKFLGRNIEISSGFRTEELNKVVGGVSNSDHKEGYAADLRIGVATKEQPRVMRYIRDHILEIRQAIAYVHERKPGFIHIAIDPKNKTRNFKKSLAKNQPLVNYVFD